MSGLPRQAIVRILLSVLLILSLYLLSAATENSSRFGRLYLWLLLINGVVLVVLSGLIINNLQRLVRSFRARETGSRLTLRLMALFVVLAVLPGLVVYGFSMQFLQRGVDSWFDVRVENALEDALALSQASLDQRMRDMQQRLEEAARDLADVSSDMAPITLGDLRARTGASELTLIGENGRIIAASSMDTDSILPHRPEESILLQLRQGRPYVGLDPIENAGLHIRALVRAPGPDGPGNTRILQGLFQVSPRINDLADEVETAFSEYRELAYLRGPLKDSFILTLSLVLLVSLLFAVWSAFYLARRLVAPVSRLAEGTRAMAAGEYGTQLPPAGNDELGFLVRSFNDMSRRVADVRDAARQSQALVESQRAYLETVLGRLSSGVLALGRDGTLRTYNQAAEDILSVPLHEATGQPLSALVERFPDFSPFVEQIEAHPHGAEGEWRAELSLDTREGRRSLICSGAMLPGGAEGGGEVIVFDDVTTLIQAQRDAAWGEVARRLAHEIRNPLTPIQLSAERLQHKVGNRVSGEEAALLQRSTDTIIHQVEAMKDMVQAFSEYARPPVLELQRVDLNALVQEVAELYRGQAAQASIRTDLDEHLPGLEADAGRLRQLLNNLIRNALEADDGGACEIVVSTRRGTGRHAGCVELDIEDNGPGFADAMLDQLFEPYVSTKPRGSGLGLAIVKKIVEEHNGSISARNVEGGARLSVRLPTGEKGE
ncbi:HAMP domain-containing protein [Spiribacter aquaticus]|uniref:histidine kinase n=1 Tax=Spiribacter aquaticus TaxID=1935996 RepID=A0A557RMN8_9GAMM|nr:MULTISPECIES: ATP-binding protein [Spiribacter]KAF0279402.1 two-component sensor histidine kinase [Spiribacter roseus]TVO66355.1 HAMP domain-containing protein [Spiribacter aquaticus]